MQNFASFVSLLIAGCLLVPLAKGQGDTCATAIPVSGVGAFPWDSTGGTDSGLGCMGTADVFWEWSPQVAGDYLVEVVWPAPLVSYDVVLGVWAGSSCSLPNPVDCNFNFFAQGGVVIEAANAGDTYLIQVSGWYSNQGQGELHVIPAPCTFPNYIDDVLEDNDSIATAVPIVEGTYTDLFVSEDDPDYYAVTIPAGHNLLVTTDPVGSYPWVNIYHANGAVIGPGYGSFNYSSLSPAPTPVVVEITKGPVEYERDRCTDYDLTIDFVPSNPRFEAFCTPAAPNSVGRTTILNAWVNAPQYGSEVVLGSYNGPPGEFGYYLVGSAFSDPGTPIGFGQLCLSGMVARYNVAGTGLNSLGQYNSSGLFDNLSSTGYFGYGFIPKDLLPAPLGSIQQGDTWYFQIWHREPNGGSHFSNGVRVQY